MRILLVGVLDVAWSTNYSMQRALEKLGHTVVPFNYRTLASEFNSNKDTLLNMWLDKGASFLRSARIPFNSGWYYRRNGRKEMNRKLLELVKNDLFDLVLLSKTDTVDYNLLKELNKYSRTWYYFMDPMDQAVRINAAAYAKNATWASATFSDVTEYFQNKGSSAHWITQGIDTDIFRPRASTKVYDVVFAGSKTVKRQRFISKLQSAGVAVECLGEGWANSPVYDSELVDIYNRSKIVLNFCRDGSGFSIRVFQVLGCGTFLLSEYCQDLDYFFREGDMIDWFATESEMIDKIQHYLQHESEREEIALKGCTYVQKNFTWDAIMARIIDSVQQQNWSARI